MAYVDGDVVTAQSINKAMDDSAQAYKLVTTPIDNSLANKVGTPRLEINTSTGGIKAIELKGEKGEAGINNAHIVSQWSSTPTNDNAPSEKLVKDNLDLKGSKLNISQFSVPYRTNSGVGEPNTSIIVETTEVPQTIVRRSSTGEILCKDATDINRATTLKQLNVAKTDNFGLNNTAIIQNIWNWSQSDTNFVAPTNGIISIDFDGLNDDASKVVLSVYRTTINLSTEAVCVANTGFSTTKGSAWLQVSAGDICTFYKRTTSTPTRFRSYFIPRKGV